MSSCVSEDSANRAASQIPIQHNGRIKSFDAFARETLQLISGRTSWRGEDALSLLLKNLNRPDGFLDIPFIRLDQQGLKKAFDLPVGEKYFSYKQIKPNFSLLYSIIQGAQKKRDQDSKLSSSEQNAELLYSRLLAVDGLAGGDLLNVIPGKEKGESWHSPFVAAGPLSDEFKRLASLYDDKTSGEFISAARKWTSQVKEMSAEDFSGRIELESYYYRMQPFFYAWIAYLIAFALLAVSKGRPALNILGIAALLAGFAFHSGGLLLRVLILRRPPVSNMFESMVFMNWVLMVCAFLFFVFGRKRFFLTSAALVSALVMIFADLLPVDKSLGVLAPVLKSSYWLITHVLTIMASYGIFGLATALGHRHLWLDAFGKFTKESEKSSADVITRLLQIGVITLGIGTVLGGVWANESWGRFWGWDPKETWALITFLGYMLIIHLRAAGRLKNFGVALGAVLGFLLVLMTWYGVNFVLGRGLHSYGFGAGGLTWVVCYLVFEAVFLCMIVCKKSGLLPGNHKK